jgi:coenzyme F420-0:L-glutamate ligase/coenzyme F420-1:gamma-L-glutamate ligase
MRSAPGAGDILVVTQKIVSKGRGALSRSHALEPSQRAKELAAITRKDPRLVEAVLSESVEVIRAKANVLIVATRHGLILANAGIDQSNLEPEDHGRRVLLLPEDPDRSAATLQARLAARFGAGIGVIISDSVGRPWRLGTVGLAIGAAGVPSLWDRRGEKDLSGRPLEVTEVGFADAVAAAAVLVMGEGGRGLPRGLGTRPRLPSGRAPGRGAAAAQGRGHVSMSAQVQGAARYVCILGWRRRRQALSRPCPLAG